MELVELDRHLRQINVRADCITCHLDSDLSPWKAIRALGDLRSERVSGLDYVVRLPDGDEREHVRCAAEAMLAAAQQPRCRLYFDTLIDLDRTNDLNHGLLDRLSNPQSACHAVPFLNTLLFSGEMDFRSVAERRGIGVQDSRETHFLVPPGSVELDSYLPGAAGDGETEVVDLVRGLRRTGIKDAATLRSQAR